MDQVWRIALTLRVTQRTPLSSGPGPSATGRCSSGRKVADPGRVAEICDGRPRVFEPLDPNPGAAHQHRLDGALMAGGTSSRSATVPTTPSNATRRSSANHRAGRRAP